MQEPGSAGTDGGVRIQIQKKYYFRKGIFDDKKLNRRIFSWEKWRKEKGKRCCFYGW